MSLTWITSFGPLMFSVAKPLNAGSDDESEVFQFSMDRTSKAINIFLMAAGVVFVAQV